LPDKAHFPDLVGLLQATSDILEKAGILENDRLIADYDGSCIAGLDKLKPRAEIVIKVANIESVDPYVQKKNIEKAQSRLFG
jgi:Holliday junction resolvase RusA-like endonuclease